MPAPPKTIAIPLSQGLFAIVDEADAHLVESDRWYVQKNHGTHYARRSRDGESMHRVITGAPDGTLVDHHDTNGLNNTRLNLRVCNKSENGGNRRKLAAGSSKFKGVTWHNGKNRWHAQIWHNGKRTHLGYFGTQELAAQAYDIAATTAFGEFANLNFQATA